MFHKPGCFVLIVRIDRLGPLARGGVVGVDIRSEKTRFGIVDTDPDSIVTERHSKEQITMRSECGIFAFERPCSPISIRERRAS